MRKTNRTLLLSVLMGCTVSAVNAEERGRRVTELDFLSEMPVVLSVTHMAQPLDEVPGALTVIDREMIRRSGAREVADLLRLVPGFLMTRTQAGLIPSYHSGLDAYSARMQVYVDGRSVYSSLFLGDTHFGLRGLVLEDIERIEVLRGSNSASFGANAFLGVVNVITRHAADTLGAMVSVTQGDGAIDDHVARVGWGTREASFRLTASRRKDSGLYNSADDANQSRLGFRGDLQVTPNDKVLVTLGAGDITHLNGSTTVTNPTRPVTVHDIYASSVWEHQLASGNVIKTRFTHDIEHWRDIFTITAYPTNISVGGRVERTELGSQYLFSLNDAVRAVGGIEYRREAAESRPLFATNDSVSVHQWRFFGNLEWRMSQNWLVQAGAMRESHSIIGNSLSPRLAANYRFLPNHTLRAVSTKAFRAPTIFELRGDRQYRYSTTDAIIPVQGRAYLAVDGLKYEEIRSDELGYLGRFREIGLTVDARAYIEKINQRIKWATRTVGTFTNVAYARNERGPLLRGYEYSLIWEPRAGTKLIYNDTRIGRVAGLPTDNQESPANVSSWVWFQDLPGGFEATVISAFSSPLKWDTGDQIGISRRLDVRLGKPFQMGATKGELAVTTQSINGGHFIHKTTLATGPWKQDRRAFITLRLDF